MQHLMQKRELTLLRVINAPRELVWRAWTEPEFFVRWFAIPPVTSTVGTLKMNVKPGGEWEAVMIAPDGARLSFVGIYLEVVKLERLVFTMDNPDNRNDQKKEIVTVTFIDKGQQTEIIFKQTGHLPEDVYTLSLKQCWESFFEQLNRSLQTVSI